MLSMSAAEKKSKKNEKIDHQLSLCSSKEFWPETKRYQFDYKFHYDDNIEPEEISKLNEMLIDEEDFRHLSPDQMITQVAIRQQAILYNFNLYNSNLSNAHLDKSIQLSFEIIKLIDAISNNYVGRLNLSQLLVITLSHLGDFFYEKKQWKSAERCYTQVMEYFTKISTEVFDVKYYQDKLILLESIIQQAEEIRQRAGNQLKSLSNLPFLKIKMEDLEQDHRIGKIVSNQAIMRKEIKAVVQFLVKLNKNYTDEIKTLEQNKIDAYLKTGESKIAEEKTGIIFNKEYHQITECNLLPVVEKIHQQIDCFDKNTKIISDFLQINLTLLKILLCSPEDQYDLVNKHLNYIKDIFAYIFKHFEDDLKKQYRNNADFLMDIKNSLLDLWSYLGYTNNEATKIAIRACYHHLFEKYIKGISNIIILSTPWSTSTMQTIKQRGQLKFTQDLIQLSTLSHDLPCSLLPPLHPYASIIKNILPKLQDEKNKLSKEDDNLKILEIDMWSISLKLFISLPKEIKDDWVSLKNNHKEIFDSYLKNKHKFTHISSKEYYDRLMKLAEFGFNLLMWQANHFFYHQQYKDSLEIYTLAKKYVKQMETEFPAIHQLNAARWHALININYSFCNELSIHPASSNKKSRKKQKNKENKNESEENQITVLDKASEIHTPPLFISNENLETKEEKPESKKELIQVAEQKISEAKELPNPPSSKKSRKKQKQLKKQQKQLQKQLQKQQQKQLQKNEKLEEQNQLAIDKPSEIHTPSPISNENLESKEEKSEVKESNLLISLEDELQSSVIISDKESAVIALSDIPTKPIEQPTDPIIPPTQILPTKRSSLKQKQPENKQKQRKSVTFNLPSSDNVIQSNLLADSKSKSVEPISKFFKSSSSDVKSPPPVSSNQPDKNITILKPTRFAKAGLVSEIKTIKRPHLLMNLEDPEDRQNYFELLYRASTEGDLATFRYLLFPENDPNFACKYTDLFGKEIVNKTILQKLVMEKVIKSNYVWVFFWSVLKGQKAIVDCLLSIDLPMNPSLLKSILEFFEEEFRNLDLNSNVKSIYSAIVKKIESIESNGLSGESFQLDDNGPKKSAAQPGLFNSSASSNEPQLQNREAPAPLAAQSLQNSSR